MRVSSFCCAFMAAATWGVELAAQRRIRDWATAFDDVSAWCLGLSAVGAVMGIACGNRWCAILLGVDLLVFVCLPSRGWA